MKKRNKLLIRLLTAVLSISLLPVTVMAAPDEENPGMTEEKLIRMSDELKNIIGKMI